MSAKRPSSSPCTSHSSHSGFERSRRWEKIRPTSWRSCSTAAGRGQRGVAHVVVDVELRVVDPERPPHLEAREGELLAVARHEVQPRLDVRDEVLARRAAAPRRSPARPTCMCDACPPGARNDASTALRRSLWPCGATGLEPTPCRTRHNHLRAPARRTAGRSDRCSPRSSSRSWPPTTCRSSTASPTPPRRPRGEGRPLRLARRLRAAARAGRARPAARRLGGLARAGAPPARPAAARPLPARARRAAQRGGQGARRAATGARSSSARTTTPRTSPASWAPTTARRAPPWRSSSRATVKPRRLAHTLVFILFDGEESPRGTPDSSSRSAACAAARRPPPRSPAPSAMVLLDFVGDRDLAHPARGELEPPRCGRKLRAAARRVGTGRRFPPGTQRRRHRRPHPVHRRRACPSIDLIDFDFPCFHRSCDDLTRGLRAQPRRHRRDRAGAAR